MKIEFIKLINEYVIDATLEASDEDILAAISDSDYPLEDDIQKARAVITRAVKEQRKFRLDQQKAEFLAYKKEQEQFVSTSTKPSISKMLSDIVLAMQNKDVVPEGLILAFREQGKDGSEEDIVKIWQSLVELGLVDLGDTDT